MKKILIIVMLCGTINAVDTQSGVWKASMIATIATIYATNTFNTQEAGFDVGISEDFVMDRFSFRWLLRDDLATLGNYTLKASTQLSMGIWVPNDRVRGDDELNHVFDIGIPWRIYSKHTYLEYGMGITYMTNPTMLPQKDMGGHFAFNHILNVGVTYNSWNLSVGYAHYSNNDIYKQNPGINYYLCSLSFEY